MVKSVEHSSINNTHNGIFNPLQISSISDLEKHIHKVVKYSNDEGKHWHYVFLEKPLYTVEGTKINNAGISACTTKKNWLNWTVAGKIVFDQDTFDPCIHRKEKIIFATAAYSEFEKLEFASYGWLSPDCASEESISPDLPLKPPFDIICKAPLTFVRCEREEVDLKIAIHMGNKFKLIEPTYPLPKIYSGKETTYLWDVHLNKDRTLDVQGAFNITEKVKMIWWEVKRLVHSATFNLQDSVCVNKNELASFLKEVLTKKGVSPKEQEAFITYWKETFEKDKDVNDLQVRLTNQNEHTDLLPNMSVSNSEGIGFDIHRLYFQFMPVTSKSAGLSKEEFFAKMNGVELGKNVVIDLGGEILSANQNRTNELDSHFNNDFIKKYIRV